MSASVPVGAGVPVLRIHGRSYPVLLPKVTDPRLHLAFVIVSLQVLGQVAFGFTLSIAQIFVALGTCAVLEMGIAFRRSGVILWPASALLTGNGVAFVLRVPGTEHGDWWSMHGWWVFAGTAAIALLSKYLIRFHGRHIFNPSNIGLVVCFLAIGPEYADPLALWWGPMTAWMALALAIIVTGGFVILRRLRLLGIAIGFWLAFAAGIGVLAVSGHEMTARWHLGPMVGFEFWRILVFSPEILVFLFFMITDPRTIPDSALGRRVYAISVALVAVVLIAPQTSEFATKVAVLGALAIVCAARPLLLAVRSTALADRIAGLRTRGRPSRLALGLGGALAFIGLLVLAGIPARPTAASASAAPGGNAALPEVTIVPSKGVATTLDRGTSRRIARDLVVDLRIEGEALRRRRADRAGTVAGGARLAELLRRISAPAAAPVVVPTYVVDRMRVMLETGRGQGPPLVLATVEGSVTLTTFAGSPPAATERTDASAFEQVLELQLDRGRYVIVGSRGAAPATVGSSAATAPEPTGFDGLRVDDVASEVGLEFRHGAFRFSADTGDQPAMMGGGVCWLDVDDDGWLDLFAVNSYSERDGYRWKQHGGLPRSGLYRNVHGRFVDVSARSGADVALRGNGCVAADFDLDGHTDLFVTAAGYDALLWNDGDGTFTEGARAAGIATYGWHTGAAVGDVNGDGLPDLVVAAYIDRNAPLTDSSGGFPSTHLGVRDLLYLNQGRKAGRVRFREVGVAAGLDSMARPDYGLGVLLTDANRDGRLDLYVANDTNPNRLYANVPWPGGIAADPKGLGFRLRDIGHRAKVADPNAGMGIASSDYSGDGRADLFVTNSHDQLHAVYRSIGSASPSPGFVDARVDFAAALDTTLAGWGVSWVDLDLDGNLDLAVANGAIPIRSIVRDAERVQVLENLAGHGRPGQFADARGLTGLADLPPRVGRGLAAADYDNDGDLDLAINAIGSPLALLRTSGAKGHWLEVDLGVFAPGAIVTVVLPDGRRLVRETHAGSSYLSSEDPRLHFGLGDVSKVRELLVRYPGGREVRLADVGTNRVVSVPSP